MTESPCLPLSLSPCLFFESMRCDPSQAACSFFFKSRRFRTPGSPFQRRWSHQYWPGDRRMRFSRWPVYHCAKSGTLPNSKLGSRGSQIASGPTS